MQEHGGKPTLRIQTAKKNMPRLYKVRSNTPPPQRTENPRNIRPPPRPQQRFQSVTASFQAPIPQLSASIGEKKRRNSSNNRPLPQTTSENASRFTALVKVQIFEQPATKSQRYNTANTKAL